LIARELLAIAQHHPRYRSIMLFDEEPPTKETICIYNTETGRLKRTPIGATGPIVSMTFSPNGRILAVGDADNQGDT
jgi:hypothetical protein